RRRHTRFSRDWSSDVCSSDLEFGARRLGLAGADIGACNFGAGAGVVRINGKHALEGEDRTRVLTRIECGDAEQQIEVLVASAREIGRAACREGGGSCGLAGAS